MEYKVKKKEYKGNVRWCVYTKTFSDKDMFTSYSESIFGIYAKKLAELTALTKIKYKNYFEQHGPVTTMIIYSKSRDKYYNVLFDTEDFDEVSKYRWNVVIKKLKNVTKEYCEHVWNKENGKVGHIRLHQFILGRKKELVIDHINGNGLDNRKCNLRHTTLAINNKNKAISTNSIFPNVTYNKQRNCFIVIWRNKEGKRKSKSYSVDELGYNYALYKAKMKSIKKRKENDYIVRENELLFIRKKKSKKDKERTILHLRKKK